MVGSIKIKAWVAAGTLCIAAAVGGTATASNYIVGASGQGWINQNGQDNGAGINRNYIAGNCTYTYCGSPTGEFRNYFTFDIPVLDDAVLAAALRLNTADVASEQAPELTYQITSTNSLTFGDLGTGTIFGRRVYSASDIDQTYDIALNAAGLSGITSGGRITISGRVSSPAVFGGSEQTQVVFGYSSGLRANLVIDTGPATGGVPEPATWTMMILGFGAVGVTVRRRRTALA